MEKNEIIIKVDNKEIAGYFESFLDDFKEISENMLKSINIDRGATLKIPDAEYNRIKRIDENMLVLISAIDNLRNSIEKLK